MFSLFLIVVSIELVNVFKDPVELSKDETLLSFDEVYELNVVSSNFPVPIAWPFNNIDPLILAVPKRLIEPVTSTEPVTTNEPLVL